MSKHDSPYLVHMQKSPTSYAIASLDNPSEAIAKYHTSALTPFKDIDTSPVVPLRKRGRPRKATSLQHTDVSNPYSVSSPGRRRSHRGRL